ncbi:MAG: 50S ribosomal protein L11 methyltransferase [Deltaproteobacteria bacterium]|nr:50S ribosomal protein L11 methyltransferase [Deltaproteobacteria bacterium]
MSVSPYRDLYVYMLGGVVPESEEGKLGCAFLGNWVEDMSSFLFFSTPSGGEVSGLLERRPELRLLEDYHFTYEEWQGGGLAPLRIDPFVISAPWQAVGPVEGEIRMWLDPGVVFGTGLHPTTRDCLSALVYLQGLAPMGRVMDLGTGTGILALAAALLGAEEVLAVDLNPLCVKTARRNVELNRLEATIRVVQGKAEDCIHEEADLVVANIHHGVLKGLIVSGAFRRKSLILLSGLMRSQAAEVRQEMSVTGALLVREWDHEMTWYTMLWDSRNSKW